MNLNLKVLTNILAWNPGADGYICHLDSRCFWIFLPGAEGYICHLDSRCLQIFLPVIQVQTKLWTRSSEKIGTRLLWTGWRWDAFYSRILWTFCVDILLLFTQFSPLGVAILEIGSLIGLRTNFVNSFGNATSTTTYLVISGLLWVYTLRSYFPIGPNYSFHLFLRKSLASVGLKLGASLRKSDYTPHTCHHKRGKDKII